MKCPLALCRLLTVALTLLAVLPARAQVPPTHGPVISGVTHNEARLYLRIPICSFVTLEASPDSLFKTGVLTTGAAMRPELDSTCILHLTGLQPNTRYYLRAVCGPKKSPLLGSFQTFPTPGTRQPFTFAFGSCQENYIPDSIYIQMARHQPRFFLQIGDWTYPDHTGYPNVIPPTPNYYYSLDSGALAQAYRTRYSLPNTAPFLAQTPVDYVYDDDDFIIDGLSRTTASHIVVTGKETQFHELPLPPGARRNAIQAWVDYFPGYPAVDTAEGVYHSFRFGNCEFFMLDTRAARSPDLEIFVRKGNKWKLQFPDGHTNLGDKQLQWLLDGLKASTADWKFIASGTNFNRGYRVALDLALKLQRRTVPQGYTGAMVAGMLSSMWIGFPDVQAALINHIAQHKIQNVVVLSGDAHTAALDDGANAGLPEAMSGNLAAHNTKIVYHLEHDLGLRLWNQGGQGVGNNLNFNNTFGQVQVFGADSVRINIIDHQGTQVCHMTLRGGILPEPVSLKELKYKPLKVKCRNTWAMLRLIWKRIF